MKDIDRLRSKASEAREKVRALLAIESRTEEQDRELEALTRQLDRLERDYRAQLAADATLRMDEPPDMKADGAPAAQAGADGGGDGGGDGASTAAGDIPQVEPSAGEGDHGNDNRAARSAPAMHPEVRAALGGGGPMAADRTAPAGGFKRAGVPEGGVHTGSTAWRGEAREFMALAIRARAGAFLNSVIRKEPISEREPERELQRALGVDDRNIPWASVLPREALTEIMRVRADAPTIAPGTVQETQRPIIARVFSKTAAAHLGVLIDSVGVGDALYHVMSQSGGSNPEFKAAGQPKEAEANTLTPTSLDPMRLTAAYALRYEDLARVVGLEEAIRADIRRAMVDAFDRQILTGDGSGGNTPQVIGFISAHTDSLPNPVDPAAVVTFATGFAGIADAVDGLYAHTAADLKVVLPPEVLRFFEGLFAANTAVSLMQYVDARCGSGSTMGCANMPDPASNIATALVAKTDGTGPNAVAPVWNTGVTVIRDESTLVSSGMVRLQMLGLHNFRILRKDAFARIEYKLA